MTASRCFAVDDRPVEVREVAGQPVAEVLELSSGAFVCDAAVQARVLAGDPRVEPLDRAGFERLVAALRRVISHDRQATEIAWTATGDVERPFRATVDGTTYTIRLGDFPVEALYHLEVDGQDVDALDTWPNAWIQQDRPSAAGRLTDLKKSRTARVRPARAERS